MKILVTEGRNQDGQRQYLMFTPTSIVAFGPYKGGWKHVWKRRDFEELFGQPPLNVSQWAAFFRHHWKCAVRILDV